MNKPNIHCEWLKHSLPMNKSNINYLRRKH